MQFPSLPASREIWLHVTCSVRACVAIDVCVSFVEVASLAPSASSVQQTVGKIFRKRSGHKCMQPVGTTLFLMISGAFTSGKKKKMFLLQWRDEWPLLVDATTGRVGESKTAPALFT